MMLFGSVYFNQVVEDRAKLAAMHCHYMTLTPQNTPYKHSVLVRKPLSTTGKVLIHM